MPRIVDINAETGEVYITEIPDDAENPLGLEVLVEEVAPPVE